MTDILHLEISGRQQGKTTRSFNKALQEHYKTKKPIVLIDPFRSERDYYHYLPLSFDKKYFNVASIGEVYARGELNTSYFKKGSIVIIDEFDFIKEWQRVFEAIISLQPSLILANTSPSFIRTKESVEAYKRMEEVDPILELISICLEENYTRNFWVESLNQNYGNTDRALTEMGVFYKGKKRTPKNKHLLKSMKP